MAEARAAPEGTIALLFTDIEDSTQLARRLGTGWSAVLARHHEIVGAAIAAHGGWVDGTEGDAFFATFADPTSATRAAIAAQRALRANSWPENLDELKVRMGLHVGHVERTTTGYVGLEVHRAARVGAAAHGGQLLLTAAAAAMVAEEFPIEALGTHRLKDFPAPEPLFCAAIDGQGAAVFPPPRTEELRPTNLPAGTPLIVGRDEDLRRVREALLADRERVVTLTGRGGSGKTSLALVAAAGLLDDFPGGIWLVRLANVAGPDGVMAAVAAAVDPAAKLSVSPEQAIVNRLRPRGPSLIVLDNMEHLTPTAPLLGGLVSALPDLQLLVTSQAPLRLADELVLPLDALEEEAALALLERTASRRAPGFTIAARDRASLREVVRLLDGLPLALELAGARLALLSPSQLAERLARTQDVLRDDRSDRPERHRSLRATVDWTLGLLEPGARELFVRLGVFAGPVELEEVELVTGGDDLDVLVELARLLDVALVRRVETGDGRIRFGLPEALRQIASALLATQADAERWRQGHAVRQAEIVGAAGNLLVAEPVYSAALAAGPEVMAALAWSRESDIPLATVLAVNWGSLLADLGQLRPAVELIEWALDQQPEPSVRAHGLWALCWAVAASGRTELAIPHGQQALALATDQRSRFMAQTMLGLTQIFAGQVQDGMALTVQATALARELGDPAVLCAALGFEAQARCFTGDLEGAADLLADGTRIGRAADAEFLWRYATLYGDLCAIQGRFAEALSHYARSLEEAERRGHSLQAMFDTFGMAIALAQLGRDEAAVETGAMGQALLTELGGPEATPFHLLSLEPIEGAAERLGPDAAAEAAGRGSAVTPAQRIPRACELGRAAGKPSAALG